MDKLFVIMPAYNESENITETVSCWCEVIDKINTEHKNNESKVVVINDGSKDNTLSILEDLMTKYSMLVVVDKKNEGHGPTILSGYKYAIEHNADYVFQVDSDNQTNYLEFYDFWKERKQYAGIFGNRVKRGDGIQRKFIENIVCLLQFLYFGVKIPDANAPFRLLNTEVLKKYIYDIPNNCLIPNVLITSSFAKKENILFKEISFAKREKGTNSINIRKIMKMGFESLKIFKEYKKKDIWK